MRSKLIGVAVATALSAALWVGSGTATAQIGISVNIAPPELPVYEQPEIPAPGYIWTPGYWAWADDGSGYYWVPGTWVEAPESGYLWTPGYWGWDSGAYLWHGGYWGPTIGFYGGVNYGFGYFGHGYDGGYWDHGQFRYNTAYNHFGGGVHISNVYNRTVVNNITVNHVSFNGGNGGIQARADAREIEAEHAHHLEPVSAQVHQREVAHSNPDLRLSANHGHPAIAATSRPGEFNGRGVIAAHGAPAITHAPAATGRGPDVSGRGPEVTGRGPEVTHAPAVAPHVNRPPDQHVPNNVPRPDVQHEVPHTTEVPHNEAPRNEIQRAPTPPPAQQHEQRPPPQQHEEHPAPREPEKREEPHEK
jgi:WXXGXW repeat (2 copies)